MANMEVSKSIPISIEKKYIQQPARGDGSSDMCEDSGSETDEEEQDDEDPTEEEIEQLKAQIKREEEEDALNVAVALSETVESVPKNEEPVTMGRTRGRTAIAMGYNGGSFTPDSSNRGHTVITKATASGAKAATTKSPRLSSWDSSTTTNREYVEANAFSKNQQFFDTPNP